MKSKTSFFNLSIYKKNLLQFWPIWSGYFLIFLVVMPGKLWFDFRNHFFHEGYFKTAPDEMLQIVGNDMNMEYFIPFVFFGAIVVAIALFSYLYSSRSANMIHALPVTREELFGTSVASGLTIMIVPPFVAFCASVIISLNYGVYCVEYFGIWFLAVTAVSFLAFGMACLCAMAAGQLVAAPVYYMFLNFAYYFTSLIVQNMVSYLGYGVRISQSAGGNRLPFLGVFFPISYLSEHVTFVSCFVEVGEYTVCDHIEFQGTVTLLGYMIPALLAYVASYFMYKYRKMENTGEVLVISFLRPIIYFAIGMLVGFGVSVWGRDFLEAMIGYVPNGLFILVTIIAGIIGFFLAKMLIKRKFKIFVPRTWMEAGVFLVLLISVYGAALGYARFQETFLPSPNQISRAAIQAGSSSVYEGENIQTVLDVHKEIVDRSNIYRRTTENESYEYVVIVYQLMDGSIIDREYRIPFCDESENVIRKIYSEECNPDVFINTIFMLQDVDKAEYRNGNITLYEDDWDYSKEIRLDSQMTEEFKEAILLDVLSGNLQKYNVLDPYSDTLKPTNTSLYLGNETTATRTEVRFWDFAKYGDVWGSGYEDDMLYLDYSIYLEVGPDCSHIIDVMKKYDMINSASEVKVLE